VLLRHQVESNGLRDGVVSSLAVAGSPISHIYFIFMCPFLSYPSYLSIRYSQQQQLGYLERLSQHPQVFLQLDLLEQSTRLSNIRRGCRGRMGRRRRLLAALLVACHE
jgi:hypothetical protein